MSEFNAARTLREVDERREQFDSGANKRVPIITAIIAVFAALATLFSNHDSIKGLQTRTQAGITQIKASDQYNYYESKRIKAEVNQALLQSGLVKGSTEISAMKSRIAAETQQAAGILKLAQAEEQQSEQELEQAERSMSSYEFHEIAATLFEVSIVLVSITALMTRSRALLYVAGGASVVGLIFFITGLVR